MARNKILDELHAARAKLLEDAGGDLNRYICEADERLKAMGGELELTVRFPQGRVRLKQFELEPVAVK
jgi:hypothetical protein